ncbi:MAG: YcxB family protein [Chitinophagales bacterium]
MILEYSLGEEDFLTYQLYNASVSDGIKKRRMRTKILVPVIYMVLGLMLLLQQNVAIGVIFLGVAVVWFFVYPLWQRRLYERHYRSFIAETYKNRFNRLVSLDLKNDCILAKDNGSESKVLTTEVEKIVEIPAMILIKLKTGQAYLLPKKKIEQVDEVIAHLKQLSVDWQVEYSVQNNWHWR